MAVRGNIDQPKGDELMFYGIGAQKAGTTWLHAYLAAHPQVTTGPLKEYHYYSHFHRRFTTGVGRPFLQGLRRKVALASILVRAGMARGWPRALIKSFFQAPDYQGIVRGGNDQALVFGDISPIYPVLDRTAFAEMADSHTNTKFVFIMRDPVARLWSQIRMRAKAKALPLDGQNSKFAKMLKAKSSDPNYLVRSDYQRTITELENAVPTSNILYLFYEDLFQDDSIRRLTDFLGIDFKKANYESFVHKGDALDMPAEWRDEMRRKLAHVYKFVAEKFGNEVPRSWWQGVGETAQGPSASQEKVDGAAVQSACHSTKSVSCAVARPRFALNPLAGTAAWA